MASSYPDYASLPLAAVQEQIVVPLGKRKGPRGGVVIPFPVRLREMLQGSDEAIVSWLPHGRAFQIHHRQAFCAQVLPRYFGTHKLTSFYRQLNIYGFTRLYGTDAGAYYHPLFLQNRPDLMHILFRTHIKGSTMSRHIVQEPDLYTYPFCNKNTEVQAEPRPSTPVDVIFDTVEEPTLVSPTEDDDDNNNETKVIDEEQVMQAEPIPWSDNDPKSFAGLQFHSLEIHVLEALETLLMVEAP